MATMLNPPIISNHEVAHRIDRAEERLGARITELENAHARYLRNLNQRVQVIEQLTFKQLFLLLLRRMTGR